MNINIKELQKDVEENKTSVSSLLRKAKIIASKLKQEEFLNWIDKELNGYKNEEKVPEYRIVKGIPQGYNPYRGWIPYMIDNPENQDLISTRGIKQPIGELEELSKNNKDSLMMKYPHDIEKILRDGVGYDIDIRLLISKASVSGVLEHVKNNILDWIIKLDQMGISKESEEFSQNEVNEAEKIKPEFLIKNIENFSGNIGDYNKITSGSIQPIETFWQKFFWYVIVALCVVIVGNIISAFIIFLLKIN